MTTSRPARYRCVELAHADALLEDLAMCASRGGIYGADLRICAASWRDEELRKLKGLICQKCLGTGQTQWRHRCGGVCFLCKGDGWTSRGRKLQK